MLGVQTILVYIHVLAIRKKYCGITAQSLYKNAVNMI